MASITFGSGKLFFKDPTTAQVYQVGIMTDVSLNFEGSSKSLYGNKQFPVATVMTSKKVTGKASFANIDGKLISALMTGTETSGRTIMNENVASGASVLVSPTGTSFSADYGVVDAAGNTMTLTGSAPTVGKYSQTGGTYTFNASEPAGALISYAYVTGSGKTLSVSNTDMGTQTNFSAFLQEKGADGETLGVEILSCIVPNLSLAFKSEDFGMQDLTFEAQAKTDGTIFKVYTE